MDTKAGRLVETQRDPEGLFDQLLPPNLKPLTYGQVVEVRGIGHFEITKIDVRGQRLVLKPIPSPIEP